MFKWLRWWTPDSERDRGRAAAKELLATNPDRDTLSKNYTAAKMDEAHPLRRGTYFAEGYIEILRPRMGESK